MILAPRPGVCRAMPPHNKCSLSADHLSLSGRGGALSGGVIAARILKGSRCRLERVDRLRHLNGAHFYTFAGEQVFELR